MSAWGRVGRRAAGAAVVLLAACSDHATQAPSGRLQIDIAGLPSDVDGQVTVRGPGSYAVVITKTTTLSGLVRGEYRVEARTVRTDSTTYAPIDSAPPPVTLASTGAANSGATIQYRLTTGRLAVTHSGLPGGASPVMTVSGPNGFAVTLTQNATVNQLEPGTYEVYSGSLTVGADVYAPRAASVLATVVASVTPAQAALTFVRISGALNLSINGLPPAVAARVRITGPNGFSRDFTDSRVIAGLLAGTYTVDADTVTGGNAQWAPVPDSQRVAIAVGGSGTVAVNYVAVGPGTASQNLTIAAAHVQQIVQSMGGAVPLIAGRDALLRVFVLGSSPGMPAPRVRVRLYDGTSLVSTSVIDPQVTAAPTAVDESSLAASWNLPIPATVVRPGLAVLAEVDPDNAVAESVETDNTWPSSGTPLPITVEAAAPLPLHFVPVVQSANGLAGRISTSNLDQYLDATKRILPVNSVTADVGQTFTTSAPVFVPFDSNGAWAQVLSEINALRAAEGSSAHYVGIIQTTYVSGIAGLAYLGGRAAIIWDWLPSASVVTAHELGHNFGRFHAPCGNVGGIDVSYPYPRGIIGVYGYKLSTGELVLPTAADIMGYCSPVWISDYTYSAILDYRLANASSLTAVSATTAKPGLLVWGRIESGRLVLEPAFDVVAPPVLPTRPGAHRIDILGAGGAMLTSLSFDGDPVADGAVNGARQFAFVVPFEAFAGRTPASITLTARGRRPVVATAAARLATPVSPILRRESPNTIRLAWSDPTVRGVMVRDKRSGRILAFARSGSMLFRSSRDSVVLTLSDGVRNLRELVVAVPNRPRQ